MLVLLRLVLCATAVWSFLGKRLFGIWFSWPVATYALLEVLYRCVTIYAWTRHHLCVDNSIQRHHLCVDNFGNPQLFVGNLRHHLCV